MITEKRADGAGGDTKTVLLCGVGGQGTVLAAHLLAFAAIKAGYDVKVSEIHGMAQRGGAVSTVVRFGTDVESMVSWPGSADVVVSFETTEALRNLPDLAENGTLIVNDESIKPQPVLLGKTQMPRDVRGRLMDLGALVVPAASIAREAGNAKTANVVLLGALSARLPFSEDDWISVVSDHVPPKTIDANIAAFKGGRAFVTERTV